MFDMMSMMGKLKDARSKMKETQERLERMQHSAEAGGGMVKATVTGKRQIVALEIDPALINPSEREMMQDLIVAAVNKALSELDEEMRAEMKKSTRDVIPDIPGLDLSSFGL